MMKQLLFTALFIAASTQLLAQHCEIISVDHFGGNGIESFGLPSLITYPNGNFSVVVSSNSTSGDINTSCLVEIANGGTTATLLHTFDANYNFLSQTCAPWVDTFYYKVGSFFYPRSNGDTIFIGTRTTLSGNSDQGIERRDAMGNILWQKFYGGSGADGVGGVAQAADGGFFLMTGTNSSDGDVGFHYGSPFFADTWILRLDNNGDKLWGKVIGGTGSDLCRAIKASADGGCYVFGVTASTDFDATGNHGSSDLHIVKLDSQGNKQWHKCLGGSGDDGSGYDDGIRVIEDGSGGFYILNRTNSQDGDVQHRLPDGHDFWLLHIDSLANIIWETTFGGPNGQYPSAFCRASDGSLWMGGMLGFNGNSLGGMIDVVYLKEDVWIVHADSLGNLINQRTLGSNETEELRVLHPLADGTVIAAGYYYIAEPVTVRSPGFPNTTEGFSDIFLARLGPNTVGVEEQERYPFQWQVFPNPAKNELHITLEVEKPLAECKVEILSTSTVVVYKGSIRTSLIVPVQEWAPGVYLVRITNDQGSSSTKKITILNS